MTNTEAKRTLIERGKNFLVEYIRDKVPENGSIEGIRVHFRWPGTNCIGYFILETDLLSKDKNGRRIRTAMHENGDDRLISHYYYEGSNKELIKIMQDKSNVDELVAEFDSLSESVNDLD